MKDSSFFICGSAQGRTDNLSHEDLRDGCGLELETTSYSSV